MKSLLTAGSEVTMYSVKEIFMTLQGEGVHSGRAAVFCRFSGCNLWSGREEDRSRAICSFCDTDFVGSNADGGKFADANSLAERIESLWSGDGNNRYVVCTGGEPALQLDQKLLDALHARGFFVAIETNGSIELMDGIDWICVSPKMGAPLLQRHGDELKVVFPQPGLDLAELAQLDFQHFFLQPMDGPLRAQNTSLSIAYCQRNPRWRLSLQNHKLVGIR